MKIEKLNHKQEEFLKTVFELWNLSDCCDDNSKLVDGGFLYEVCYGRSAENMKDWILFKPTYLKTVEFIGRLNAPNKKL